jgi:hypothetical protein
MASNNFIFLKNHWNKSAPIFTKIDVFAMGYYLDSFLNANVFRLNESIMLKSLDDRTILYIEKNGDSKSVNKILKMVADSDMFLRSVKNENYEIRVNKNGYFWQCTESSAKLTKS